LEIPLEAQGLATSAGIVPPFPFPRDGPFSGVLADQGGGNGCSNPHSFVFPLFPDPARQNPDPDPSVVDFLLAGDFTIPDPIHPSDNQLQKGIGK
jgi:hypothetical protein